MVLHISINPLKWRMDRPACLVYGTEVLCQFGVRKAWEKPDAINHVQEILAPFDASIPEYMTEHIHIVSYQYHHAQDRAQRERDAQVYSLI